MPALSEDVNTPEIGQRYLVNCVWADPFPLGMQPRWWPVLGSPHTDPEISVRAANPHWHCDWRFVSELVWHRVMTRVSNGETPLSYAIWTTRTAGNTTRRILKLKRPMPAFPKIAAQHLPVLEHACANSRLNLDTMRCPHRGICLRGIPPDSNGVITCPGHGLKWNANTGELVPHSKNSRSLSL
jgi:hypothetical protein